MKRRFRMTHPGLLLTALAGAVLLVLALPQLLVLGMKLDMYLAPVPSLEPSDYVSARVRDGSSGNWSERDAVYGGRKWNPDLYDERLAGLCDTLKAATAQKKKWGVPGGQYEWRGIIYLYQEKGKESVSFDLYQTDTGWILSSYHKNRKLFWTLEEPDARRLLSFCERLDFQPVDLCDPEQLAAASLTVYTDSQAGETLELNAAQRKELCRALEEPLSGLEYYYNCTVSDFIWDRGDYLVLELTMEDGSRYELLYLPLIHWMTISCRSTQPEDETRHRAIYHLQRGQKREELDSFFMLANSGENG